MPRHDDDRDDRDDIHTYMDDGCVEEVFRGCGRTYV